jgi:hypothetical protein
MQKPTKFTSNPVLVREVAPNIHNPAYKTLYEYGIVTGNLVLQNKKDQDPAKAKEILQRCFYEGNAWLAMSPPEYHGAAKQYINVESLLFQLGYDSNALKITEQKTDEIIAKCTTNLQAQLREAVATNREQRTFLPCCAACGKYQPKDGFMCPGCYITEYCSLACKQKHWEDGHNTLCGKQRACAACGNVPHKPIQCSRCTGATYCNEVHQMLHWKNGHKKECKKF